MGARACDAKDIEPSPPGLEETINSLDTETINNTETINSSNFKLENARKNFLTTNDIIVVDLDDDQEEGEIIDDFEEIISSEEELVIGERIKELERQNVELGKIEKTSTSHNYDYFNPHLAIDLVSDSDNEFLEPPYYSNILSLKYSQNSHRSSSQQLIKKNENKKVKKSKTKKKHVNRQDYEPQKHNNYHRHKHHKSKKKSFESPKNNNLSKLPLLVQRGKRKYAKVKSNSGSSINFSSSEEENSDYNKLNRDQLRIALNGNSTSPRRGNFKNYRKKLEHEGIVKVDTPNNIEYREEESDDSVTLEEQELRLIALKSAVVQKHLKRKQRRENEKPYSPSDFVDQIIQNIPSPKTMGNSPVASPNENDDILSSEDMELVNSNSDSNDNSIHLKNELQYDYFQPIKKNLNKISNIESTIITPQELSAGNNFSSSEEENSKIRIISANHTPDPNDEEELELRKLLLSQKKTNQTCVESFSTIDRKENVSNISPVNLTESDISDLRGMILDNMKKLTNRTHCVLKEAVKRLKREKKIDETSDSLNKTHDFISNENTQNLSPLINKNISDNEVVQPMLNNTQTTEKNQNYSEAFNTNIKNSTNYLLPEQNLLPVPTFYPNWQNIPENPLKLPVNQINYVNNDSPNNIKPIERTALKTIPLIDQNLPKNTAYDSNINLKEINIDEQMPDQNLVRNSKTAKNEILKSRLNEIENEINVDDPLKKDIVLKNNMKESKENEDKKMIEFKLTEKTSAISSCLLGNKKIEKSSLINDRKISIKEKGRSLNANHNIKCVQNLENTIEKSLHSKLSLQKSITKSQDRVKLVQNTLNSVLDSELKRKVVFNEPSSKKPKMTEIIKIEPAKRYPPSCPKVQKLIININSLSDSDSDNFELNDTNYTNNQSYDDNASPMSFQMDSPCYSPLNLLTKVNKDLQNENEIINKSIQKNDPGVGKSVINDVFEAKLNDFLKNARTNVDNTKKLDTPTNDSSALAVCHLSRSSQNEYQKLVLRMKLLEKQKILKLKEKKKTEVILPNSNNSIKNFKITIKNDCSAISNSKDIVEDVNKTKLINVSENNKLIKTIVNDIPLVNSLQNEDNIKKNKISKFVKNNIKELGAHKKLDYLQIEAVTNDLSSIHNTSKETNKTSACDDIVTDEIVTDENPVIENDDKIVLLKRYEEAYDINGSNILSNLNKALQLVNMGQQEKMKKIELQSHLDNLRKQCEKIEEKIRMQNKKISKIYPEISNSHRIIGELKSRRLKLDKAAQNLGKTVQGDNYSVKDEKKIEIFNKFKEFSKGITILKNLKLNDKKSIDINMNEKAKIILENKSNVIDEIINPNLEIPKNNFNVKPLIESNLPDKNEIKIVEKEKLNVKNCNEDIKSVVFTSATKKLPENHTSKYNLRNSISVGLRDGYKCDENITIQYSVDYYLVLKQDTMNQKHFMFNKPYASPLDYNTRHIEINSQAILCPFQLTGLCDDTECIYLHL